MGRWLHACGRVAVLGLSGLWIALAGTHQTAAAGLTSPTVPAAAAATPDTWQRGACQVLPPNGPARHHVVFLDPGHGSPDPGTSGRTPAGQTVYEKTLALATAQTLAGLLRRAGFTVVLSRTRDSSVAVLSSADVVHGVFSAAGKHTDLVARVACANARHAELLLSLHFNGYSDARVGGTETFYDAARGFSAQNQRFAGLVQRNVVGQLAAAGWQVPDRGIATDVSDDEPTLSAAAAAYGYLLELGPAKHGYLDQPSSMPGALVEPLFLTNRQEAALAASAAGQAAIAHGLARAIEQFFTPGIRP